MFNNKERINYNNKDYMQILYKILNKNNRKEKYLIPLIRIFKIYKINKLKIKKIYMNLNNIN